MPEIKLSVVILSYNSLSLLDKCLRSIYEYNDIGEGLEVLLVDNNSINQTDIFTFVSQHFPSASIILQNTNSGYGAGNNLGIRQAKGEVVMLMNPDVVLCESIFSFALSVFEKNKCQALLGLKQLNQWKRKVHSFLMRELTISNFVVNQVFQKLDIFNPRHSVISGACFFLNRDMFLEVGGYDEEIFLYGEERILHERIVQRYPSAKISICFRKGYVHPISDRSEDTRIFRLGLQSYFHLRKSLRIPPRKTYLEVVRYYKMLRLFYSVKRKKNMVQQIDNMLVILKNEFNRGY